MKSALLLDNESFLSKNKSSTRLGYIQAFLLAFIVLWQLLGFVPRIPSNIYIGVLAFISLFIFKYKNNLYWPILLLILYIPINIVLCNPNRIFQSWLRYMGFVVVILSVSPLLQSNYSRNFRKNSLLYILTLITILSVASFFAYFMSINYNHAEYSSEIGLTNFAGLTNHSMVLGPISGLAICFQIFLLFSLRGKIKILLYLSLVCSIGSLLFAASRGAFVGTVCGAGIMLLIFSHAKKKLLQYAVVLGIIIAATSNLWVPAMEGMIFKQENTHDLGRFGTRTDRWEYRIREFEENPIIGVGFSSVDLNIDDRVNLESGVIEPGSSWLSILSMLGIIGFIIFLRIYYQTIKNLIDRSIYTDPWRILLLGLVALFSVHMMIEGYVFAFGSPLCLILWLVLGNAVDIRYR